MVSPSATTFVEQASEWCELFSASVHVGIKPDSEQPGLSQVYFTWLGHVRPFVGQFGVAYLGKQVRDRGRSTDEMMGLMRAGEWDPYQGVAMPVPSTDTADVD